MTEELTQRERQSVELYVTGSCRKQVAHSMGLSPATVMSHLCSAKKKLGARNDGHLGYLFAAQMIPRKQAMTDSEIKEMVKRSAHIQYLWICDVCHHRSRVTPERICENRECASHYKGDVHNNTGNQKGTP